MISNHLYNEARTHFNSLTTFDITSKLGNAKFQKRVPNTWQKLVDAKLWPN